MATDDAQVLVGGQASAPANYTIPGNGQIRPKVVFAKYDGTATTSAYVPALKITSDGGETVGIFPAFETVAAGGSVNVSWFPDVDEQTAATSGTVGSTIESIVSPAATIAVGQSQGPNTSLDLSNTGVAAGSYGDSSHTPQLTVDANGRITAAASVGIAGGSGTIGFEIGYDQITAAVNIGSTNEAAPTTVITCAAHTFDGSPVLAHFFAPYIQNSTSGFAITIALWEGAAELTRLGIISVGAATPQIDVGVSFFLRFTPTAAAHSYLVRGSASSLNGTPQVGAGAGSGAAYPPAFLRFTKV